MALHENANYSWVSLHLLECERAKAEQRSIRNTYPFVSAFPPNGDQPFFLSDFLE